MNWDNFSKIHIYFYLLKSVISVKIQIQVGFKFPDHSHVHIMLFGSASGGCSF